MYKAVLFVFYDSKIKKVLSEKRPADNHFYPNKLTFPAGTVKEQESLEETFFREIAEEFGVIPIKYDLLTKTPIKGNDGEYLLYPYIITEWKGTLPKTILDKGNATRWETLKEVAQSDISTRSQIVKLITAYLKSEKPKKAYPLSTSFLFFIVVIIVIGISLFNLESFFAEKPQAFSASLFAFGSNNAGQLGTSPDTLKSGLHNLTMKQDIVKVSAGRNFSAALTRDGKLLTWGGNDWGQLGYKTLLTYESNPHINPNLTNVTNLAVSNNHAVVLKNDGTVWTFGSNFSGQLGNGTNDNSTVPIQVKNIKEVAYVAAGYKFSIAVKKDGTLWGWGAKCDTSTKKLAELWWKNIGGNMNNIDGGYYDPLSDSLVYYDKNEYCINEEVVGILSKVPIHIKNITDVLTASAGYGHVLALKKDGTVWSFGCNTFGQLGNREAVNKKPNAIPQKIDELKNIQEVSAGYRHSLALQKDGTVWGWGLNAHGQLGNSTTKNTSRPVKLPIKDVVHIIAGFDYSLFLKKDGTVWGTGLNKQRWFKDSEDEYVTKPVQMKQMKNVIALAAGGGHILGMSKD